MTSRHRLLTVLKGGIPDRVPFAPNIGQWFEYHKANNTLPDELSDCQTEWDAMEALNCDIFSRRLCAPVRLINAPYETVTEPLAGDTSRTSIHTPVGTLSSVSRFDRASWTTFTLEHPVKDPDRDLPILQWIIENSQWGFEHQLWDQAEKRLGEKGVLMIPFFQSPIKLIHNWAGQQEGTFILLEREKECDRLFEVYKEKVWKVAREALDASALVFCLMDNLDSLFHTPTLIKRYAFRFYGDLADFFHQRGRLLFSHGDGRLRSLIAMIRDTGLDGLEGIPHPPIGDLNLYEARKIHKRFIVMGGITAHESEVTGPEALPFIFDYCKGLLDKMRPFGRFIFSTG